MYQSTVPYLAGAEGKRGENSRTVFGDAPEENKEKIKRVYRSEDLRLYFRAVGEPKVRVHFTPAIFQRKNKSGAEDSVSSRCARQSVAALTVRRDCHSLPLPIESAHPRTKKYGMPKWTFRIFLCKDSLVDTLNY